MKTVYIVQTQGPDGTGYHAYDASKGLTNARYSGDAARFTTRKDAEAVAKNYVNATVLEADVSEFAHRVRVINTSGYALPKYAHEGDSGMDVRAIIDKPITLKPLERTLIPTGITAEIPVGMEIQVRPKSGLGHKYGITVLNTPGTIDSRFRDEIKANIVNLSNEEYTIEPGQWIAQIVLARVEKIQWAQTDELTETERGKGGHGSTGTGLN